MHISNFLRLGENMLPTGGQHIVAEGKSDEVSSSRSSSDRYTGPHEAWCAFDKSDATVLTGHRTCMAGLALNSGRYDGFLFYVII